MPFVLRTNHLTYFAFTLMVSPGDLGYMYDGTSISTLNFGSL